MAQPLESPNDSLNTYFKYISSGTASAVNTPFEYKSDRRSTGIFAVAIGNKFKI
ncbi:hypothetical protein [Chamaesiphon sp.]|uniref:hypothetical protein n=1 Tax=Chamaesiphon sp. TaxID=2814140 RepID=UPI003594309A